MYPLDSACSNELVPNQIRVVRRRDVVLRQGTCHVMVDLPVTIGQGWIVARHEEVGEGFPRHDWLGDKDLMVSLRPCPRLKRVMEVPS